MIPYHKQFSVEILTPDGPVYSGKAVMVSLPATDGMMGILAERAPVVAALGYGPIIVEEPDQQEKELFAQGGFAQFDANDLRILAEKCWLIDSLDPEEAWEELQAARRMPRETPEELALAETVTDAARVKFRLIQRRRQEEGLPVFPGVRHE